MPRARQARGQHDALGCLSALGPYFAVQAHPAAADPQPPWRPLRELTRQPGPLLARIEQVRGALADRAHRPVDDIPVRVAASVTHLGLIARLIAPALAAAACPHHLDMSLDGLWWQDTIGGPIPL